MKMLNYGSGSFQYTPIVTEPGISRKGRTEEYQYEETRQIVQLVREAADLLVVKGEAAFNEFRVEGSRWRSGETYIFVLDPEGNMLVHSDPGLEGKNQINLKDINGKPIIRGLIDVATALPEKPQGWYHYQWPVPGGLLPRWKSSYVQLEKSPSGKTYIIGSGTYNDRMEREFVVDLVKDAVGLIEKKGEAAFQLLADPTGPFIAKDTYIFVSDLKGLNLVDPGFRNLEGRNILDLKDTEGKQFVREMINVLETKGSGWVDYMWPKPGESVSTQKSTYASKARFGVKTYLVACGVYLADAPREISRTRKMTAPELMTLVREAAGIFEKKGENAYPEFRVKGSKWFHDEIYFFLWSLDGIRIFYAPEPEKEGLDLNESRDTLGRPFGRMILEVGKSPIGEGWVHYMYPQPDNVFPTWKSSFVKRVKFPSGKEYIVGCGIYNMEMDKAFIEDVVNRAVTLVKEKGKEAFAQLRDKTGPFVFMDTYVFVDSQDGVELVNAAQPSLEGKNLLDLKDLRGKTVVKDEIELAMKEGMAWLECYWYRPGDNKPALKQTYVRKAQSGEQVYIVGSGLYVREPGGMGVQKIAWEAMEKEKLNERLSRKLFHGKNGTMVQFFARKEGSVERHSHISEEYLWMVSGKVKFVFDDHEEVINVGEGLIIPSQVPHSIVFLDDSECIEFFTPVREDWIKGEDQYLRKLAKS